MRKVLLFIFLCLAFTPTEAQEAFDFDRGYYPYGKRNSQFCNLFRHDSYYYLEGYVDYGWYGTYPSQFKFFMKTDLEGNVERKVAFDDSLIAFGGQHSNSIIQTRTGFVNAASVQDSFFTHGVLMHLDFNLDTIWLKRYHRQIFDSNAMRSYFLDVKQMPDLGFVLTGYISKDYGNAERYPYLMRVDKDGKVMWIKRFFSEEYRGVRILKLEFTPDNGMLLLSDLNMASIIKTDQYGEIQWVTEIPKDSLYAFNADMTYLGSTEYIIAAPYIYLSITGSTHYTHYFFGISLTSINGISGEVNWQKVSHPYRSFSYYSGFRLHRFSPYGFGVSASLEFYNAQDSSYVYQGKHHGVFLVFDNQGDSIASFIFHRDNPTDCHINDMLVEASGHLVGAGSSFGYNNKEQIAWFFRSDSTLVSGLFEEKEVWNAVSSIRVYPVPARNMVFFEFQAPLTSDSHLHIYSVEGKLVFSTELAAGVSLHPIPVNSLTRGLYVYHIQGTESDGNRGKFVVL